MLVVAITSSWANQTTLIDGVTLPDVPTETLDLATQEDFEADADGWIVFNPQTEVNGKSKNWFNALAWNSTSATVSDVSSYTAPFKTLNSTSVTTVRKSERTKDMRFTGAETLSILGSSSNNNRRLTVSLFTISGNTQTLVETKYTATGSSFGELLFENLSTSTTYVVYFYADIVSGNDGNTTLAEVALKAPAGVVDPEFSLTNTTIGTDETSQIQVGTKGNLDGISFDGDVTFGTDDIVSVNASGVVTPIAAGTTTINFSTSAVAGKYNASTGNSLTITVKGASDLTLSSSEENLNKSKVGTVTYTTTSTGEVTVSSNADAVATASINEETKTITIDAVGAGVATITVSQESDATHAAGSKTIAVTVTDPEAGQVVYNWNNVGTTTIVSTATTANVSIKGKSTAAISFPNGLTKPAYAKIETTGGFKKGDIISWTGCISNASAEKEGAIMIANGYDVEAEGYKAYLEISDKFNNVNNGSTEASTGSFVLTEDATELYIGRAISGLTGATNTYVTQLTVTRPTTVTITLGAGGYSTYAGEYKFTVSGAKALSAQNKANSVGFTEIAEGTVIPANTGIVLQGTEGDEVTITYTNADASSVENNDMVGVTEANPFVASDNVYVIATKAAGTKFYKYTGATFPVGKAYLNSAANTDALDIDFGQATAVEAVAEANAEASAPVKVIKNGKLFIGNYNVAGQQVK